MRPPKRLLKKLFKKIEIITAILILVAIFFLSFWFVDTYFSVSEIKIKGDYNKELISGITFFNGKNIFLLNTTKGANFLLKANPWLKKVTLTEIYPHTLSLTLEKNQPVSDLKVGNGFFLLSREGVIIAKSKKHRDKFPIIRYFQKFDYLNFQVGDKISYKDILFSLNFASIVNNLGYKINSIDIDSKGMIALNLTEGGKKIIFSSEKSGEEQSYEVKLVLERFRIEGKDFRSVDLRFNKPIIKLK